MKQATLIVNPKAGRSGFQAVESTLLAILNRHGFEARVCMTTAEVDSARALAHEASTRCDLVLACGGDGTVHGVLQGVAGTETALGVLLFGTANALARNLTLPMDPVQALETLLTFAPRSIPLGRVDSAAGSRWFTVMAGAGPDGTLIHEMQTTEKASFGRRAYYREAARLFLTRRFPAFQVEYRQAGCAHWHRQKAVGVMVSRIADLGGMFSGLTRTCRVHHPHLVLHLLRGPAHMAFPAWFAAGRLGILNAPPWLTRVEVDAVRCRPSGTSGPVYAQVDGEAFGTLPVTLGAEKDALRLMMPPRSD